MCCQYTPYGFSNQSTTTIPFGAVQQVQYGKYPKVTVYYLDAVTGEYYQSTFFTPVKFTGTDIVVDHGGPNSGFITIT